MLVATHDAEFAAAWADRTILLGDGLPVADAPTAEVLGGGWYFATQTARVLGGGALLPGGRRGAVARARDGGGGAVSWVVASMLILGAALAAGFAWYERTHPSTRVIALVATLAALAAIGRIAFAALPNVKPTTDIVLISGYVLGGAPGFAVGVGRRAGVEHLLRAGTRGRRGRWSAGAASACSARCSGTSHTAGSAAAARARLRAPRRASSARG